MITPVFVACYSSVCAICNSCCFQLMSWLFLYLIIFDCLLETPGKKYRNNIRSEMLSSFRDFCFLPSPLHPFIPPSLSLSFSFCLSFVAIYINPFVIGQQIFQMVELLLVFQFLQSSDGRLYHDGRSIVGPDTTRYYYFHTGAVVLYPRSLSLISVLPKEQVYLAYWLILILFTVFLREVP